MPAKRYRVELTPDERQDLIRLVSAGKRSARTLTRARVLLQADQADGGPAWDDGRIAEALGCGRRTVERVRQRLVEEGLDAALAHKPQCRPFLVRKQSCLTPRRQYRQPLGSLSRVFCPPHVQVQAVGAAVDLGNADVEQFQQPPA